MDVTALADLPRYTEGASAVDEAAGDDLGKDAFLKLLTVQLRNQDPTEPLKNEAFVAQLAQFSSLEQLVGMQETMTAVYDGIAAMNNSSMSALLGREVTAVGGGFDYVAGGSVDLTFEAAGTYDSVTLAISDAAGNVIDSVELPGGGVGERIYTWDGKDSSGQPVDSGTYTFSVVAEGEDAPEMRTLVKGTITGMDYSTGAPLPSVGNVPIALDAILRLGI